MISLALNFLIALEVTGYPPRRPLLVIGEPPAASTVDNPAATTHFANSVTAISRSS